MKQQDILKHYLGTGLKGNVPLQCGINLDSYNEWCYLNEFPIFSEFKPIFNPLSSLTKLIKVEGYNEGKEFVPIVELGKIFGWDNFNTNLTKNYIEEGKIMQVEFEIVNQLIKWHLNVFEQYMDSDSWINKETLNK